MDKSRESSFFFVPASESVVVSSAICYFSSRVDVAEKDVDGDDDNDDNDGEEDDVSSTNDRK